MRGTTPRLTTILSSTAGVGFFALNEYAATRSDWAEMPFFWLSLIAFAFAAGTLVHDLYNKESWFNRLRRRMSRTFDVVGLEKTKNGEETALVLEIRARRKLQNAELIVRHYTQNKMALMWDADVIHKERGLHLAHYETKKIVLLTSKSGGNVRWGSKDVQSKIRNNYRNLLQIALEERLRGEETRLLVVWPDEADCSHDAFRFLRGEDWDVKSAAESSLEEE